jgi:hypothetical protein
MQAGRRCLDRILSFPVRNVELWVVKNLEQEAVLQSGFGAGPCVPETIYIADFIAIVGWDRQFPNGESRRSKQDDDIRIKIKAKTVCLKWDFLEGGSAVGPVTAVHLAHARANHPLLVHGFFLQPSPLSQSNIRHSRRPLYWSIRGIGKVDQTPAQGLIWHNAQSGS